MVAVRARLASTQTELEEAEEGLRDSEQERDGLQRELHCVSESRREIEGKLATLLAGTREVESRAVSSLRSEKVALQRSLDEAQLQLADVKGFMRSDRGSTLKNMELALAQSKLQLAQCEGEKDDLEMRLEERDY